MKFFWSYIFPPLYGLLIYANIRLVNDLVDVNMKFWERPWSVTLTELTTSILYSYLFVFIVRKLEANYFNRGITDFSFSRIAKEMAIIIFIIFLLINFTIIPMVIFTDDGISDSDYVQINLITCLYFLLYFSIRRGNYYIQEFIQNKLLLERVENDRLNTELEFLKGQFSPHFLFNGLNNIYFQMNKDVPQARKNIEKLSELLQYQLYQDQKKTVPLSKESKFIALYAEVHRIRRNKELKIALSLSSSNKKVYPHLFIPLIENAFKYVAGPEPSIQISLTETSGLVDFFISNTTRKLVPKTKGGIGLKNLRRRLELLYPQQQKLSTRIENDIFIAELQIPVL